MPTKLTLLEMKNCDQFQRMHCVQCMNLFDKVKQVYRQAEEMHNLKK